MGQAQEPHTQSPTLQHFCDDVQHRDWHAVVPEAHV